MNPMHTTFLTGAQDGTVLLWDLRADKAQVCRLSIVCRRPAMLNPFPTDTGKIEHQRGALFDGLGSDGNGLCCGLA